MQAIEAIGFGAEFGPQLNEALESKKALRTELYLIFVCI